MDETAELNSEITEFVSDFLQYKLNQYGYEWSSMEHRSQDVVDAGRGLINSKVGAALRSLADEFSSQYKDNFVEMCGRLDISENTLRPMIVGIANELFSEGIKWARIVALFVFGSELAVHCQGKNWPHLTNIISQTIATYISEKLLPWINDHGGWEGLVTFNENIDSEQSINGTKKRPSMKDWLWVISGLGALGALGTYLALDRKL